MKKTLYPERRYRAFTLIELLVVVAIIAVLAGLLFPVMNRVSVNRMRSVAFAELNQVETAIKAYQKKFGFYPPDSVTNVLVHPLYFELVGSIRLPTGEYTTLDGRGPFSAAQVADTGVTAFINSSTSAAGGDEGTKPESFLTEVKSDQLNGIFLACSEGRTIWAYNSSHPTNNPASYDLWVDLIIGGKTNRISNWSKQPQIL